MPHGIRDQQSDAPTWVVEASTGKTGKQQFGNTVFGVSAVEATVTNGLGSPGWVRAVVGTGPLESVTIVSGGTGYAASNVVRVTAHNGVNAAANVTVDGNGTITSVVFSDKGGLFRKGANLAITTAGGTGANLQPVLTGRAGRVQFETIVATRNITTDATDFANTSTANVANSSGSADDSLFPDA